MARYSTPFNPGAEKEKVISRSGRRHSVPVVVGRRGGSRAWYFLSTVPIIIGCTERFARLSRLRALLNRRRLFLSRAIHCSRRR